MASADFFAVPTIRFQVLYVFLVLAHDRRRILHFAVTDHPTAEWTAQQLREAFHWDTAPRYLLRDRDKIFGQSFVDQVKAIGIKQVLSAPRSPWQRAYVERVTGAIRRECLDRVIVFNKRDLSRHLQAFLNYDHRTRTILDWRKTLRIAGLSNRMKPVGSFQFPRTVAFITATSVAPLNARAASRPFRISHLLALQSTEADSAGLHAPKQSYDKAQGKPAARATKRV